MSDKKFTTIGNIQLVKNAPRDKAGKRTGRFSQPDQSINTLAAEIGFDAYCIYHFMLNSAGSHFWCTAKTLSTVFKNDKLSENRIKKAMKKLCDANLIAKEKQGYESGKNGKPRPIYQYKVYEISTKFQSKIEPIEQMLNNDFSTAEIDAVANSFDDLTATAIKSELTNVTPPKMVKTKSTSGDEYRAHILQICLNEQLFNSKAKEKVVDCCRRYYSAKKQYADDLLIRQFANRFSEDSSLAIQQVYDEVMAI